MDMGFARGDCPGAVDAEEAADDATRSKLVVTQSCLLTRSVVGTGGGAGEASADSRAQRDPRALLGNGTAAHLGRARLAI